MKRVNFKEGEIIYNQVDRSDYCYQVLEGAVEIRRTGRDKAGKKYVQAVLPMGRDAIFGEMALISDMKRAASAVATEPTTCLALTGDEVLTALEANPADAAEFVMTLIRRLREARVSVDGET